MFVLVRALLLLAALVVAVLLVITHGVRGIVVLIAVAVVLSAPQTRVFRSAEQSLVKVTGSRQRAAAVVLGVSIAVLAGVNIYSFVHG